MAAGQAVLKGATSLTFRGTLNYQACDDKVCFNPQTGAPVVDGRPESVDRERAPGQ